MNIEKDIQTTDSGHKSFISKLITGFLNFLASLKFTQFLLLLIIVACILGTLLPQNNDVSRYLEQNPSATGRMELFEILGLTHIFSSWWFTALLSTLFISLSICTCRRFKSVLRQKGRARIPLIGSVLTHISLLLVLTGGVIRGVWGESGYIELIEGQTKNNFIIEDKTIPLPFSINLVDFEIETYAPSSTHGENKTKIVSQRLIVIWSEKNMKASIPVKLNTEQKIMLPRKENGSDNYVQINILRYISDFVIDTTHNTINSRSDEPVNPAILVESDYNGHTNTQWVFAKYPDFSMHTSEKDKKTSEIQFFKFSYNVQIVSPPPPRIKDYKSTLRLLENKTVVKEKRIEVNSPLSYKGYTFYQSGYNPQDPSWTSLQVVHDPGIPIVYTGFAMMIIGLIMVLYLRP